MVVCAAALFLVIYYIGKTTCLLWRDIRLQHILFHLYLQRLAFSLLSSNVRLFAALPFELCGLCCYEDMVFERSSFVLLCALSRHIPASSACGDDAAISR